MLASVLLLPPRRAETIKTPLLHPLPAPMQAPEALSIDEWYARARGSGRIFPGWLAARAILSIGMPFYGLSAMAIFAPTYFGRLQNEEWFGGTKDGDLKLASVSSAFFALWGPATFVASALADRVGRKPVLLGTGLVQLATGLGCAASRVAATGAT